MRKEYIYIILCIRSIPTFTTKSHKKSLKIVNCKILPNGFDTFTYTLVLILLLVILKLFSLDYNTFQSFNTVSNSAGSKNTS